MRSKTIHVRFALLLAAASVGSIPGAGASQQISTVPAEVTCPACKIRLVRVRTLDPGTAYEGLRHTAQVVRNSRGYYYSAPTHDAGKVAVFDPEGRYLGSVGERGSGPGELPEVRRIFIGPGDSLYVSGRGTTVNVFDPANRFVRSFRGPARPNDVLFDGRRLLVSAEPTSMRSGPVQALAPDGNPAGFVTKDEWSLLTPLPFELFRGGRGMFWTAQSDGREYRLGLHRTGGGQVRAFRRDIGATGREGIWRWVPDRFMRERAPVNPMSPRLKDFVTDGQGRIWILLLRENEEWLRDEAKKRRSGGGEDGGVRRLGVEDTRQRFDRFLEVFDPASGRVVTRAHVPHLAGEFLDFRHLYTFRETRAGAVAVDIWRLQLENLQTTGGR